MYAVVFFDALRVRIRDEGAMFWATQFAIRFGQRFFAVEI